MSEEFTKGMRHGIQVAIRRLEALEAEFEAEVYTTIWETGKGSFTDEGRLSGVRESIGALRRQLERKGNGNENVQVDEN